MRHYLYRHIRLDKDEPFYIGIGTKTGLKDSTRSNRTIYSRAYSKQRKNSILWNNIIRKTNYTVEILFESNDYDFIKEKEIEFISLYGRINLKTGTLANLTEGGDGTLGWIPSEENLDNLKKSKIGRDYSNLGIKIYQYDLNGIFIKEWSTMSLASKSIGVHKSYLSKLIKENLNGNFCKGFYWYNYKTEIILQKKYRYDNRNGLIMLDPITLKEVRKFDTTKEAFAFFGKSKCNGSIPKGIRENRIVFGYRWKEGGESCV